MMKTIDLAESREFNPLGMKSIVLHDSEHFKILNFNIKGGHIFPIHSHDLDGQLSILVIEGEGAFLGDNDVTFPAKTGDMLVSDIREPHGVRADTDMRIVVTIAPPI
jgi:quercetin dioxygenase-like cupin family protein